MPVIVNSWKDDSPNRDDIRMAYPNDRVVYGPIVYFTVSQLMGTQYGYRLAFTRDHYTNAGSWQMTHTVYYNVSPRAIRALIRKLNPACVQIDIMHGLQSTRYVVSDKPENYVRRTKNTFVFYRD